MLSLFITDDGNADNTLSMPQSSIGNLLMPADLLQKAGILPAKTRIVGGNINSDEALSLMTDLFYPKDFTMTSLTTTIIDHRQSIPKLFPKKLAIPGAQQFALGGMSIGINNITLNKATCLITDLILFYFFSRTVENPWQKGARSKDGKRHGDAWRAFFVFFIYFYIYYISNKEFLNFYIVSWFLKK